MAGCRHAYRTPTTGDLVHLVHEIGPHRFTARAPGRVCITCGAQRAGDNVTREFALRIAAELRHAPAGFALRFMRETLGVRAGHLAKMLDVAPATLSRWENGRREVPRAMFALVVALVLDAVEERSLVLETLRALTHGRSSLPSNVEIRLGNRESRA